MAWYEIVALLIGAVGGLSGLAALISARSAARKTDVEALTSTITALQRENARLRQCIEDLEKKQASQDQQIHTQAQQIADQASKIQDLERDNRSLRRRIRELERENCKLRGEPGDPDDHDKGADGAQASN